MPDNVPVRGWAGETVRRKLLQECDVHTLLRLPTGVFYAQGVTARVLFFDRKSGHEQPWTQELWIDDLRTNQHFTLKQNPLNYEALYYEAPRTSSTPTTPTRHERNETDQFRKFTLAELLARDKASLDIFWLRDESLEDADNLAEPAVIAADRRRPGGSPRSIRRDRGQPYPEANKRLID